MIATREYIELLVAGLSVKSGVTIKEGDVWHYDKNKNTLFYTYSLLAEMPFDVVRGYLLYEIGRVKYIDQDYAETDKVKKYGLQKLIYIYAAFEDIFIFAKMYKEYGGYALPSMNATNGYVYLMNIKKDVRNLPKIAQLMAFISTRFFSYYNNKVGFDSSDAYDLNLRMTFDPTVISRYRNTAETFSNIILNVLHNNCPDQLSLQDYLDKKFIPLVKDFLEEETQDQKQQPQNNQSQDNQSKNGQSNKQSDQGKKDQQKVMQVNIQIGGRKFSTQDTDFFTFSRPSENEVALLLRPYITTLSNRLRDVLKEAKAVKFRGSHKIGKLLDKNTYKAILNEERIFSRKTTPDSPDYNFYLAIDKSGSMAEEKKYLHAFFGAVLLKQTMQKLKFHHDFYSFSINGNRINSLEQYLSVGGGTFDGAALELILQDINKNPDLENLIFVITDGETEERNRLKTITKIKKKKGTIVGIGIGTGIYPETLKRNYEHSIYVPKVEELPMTLISTLKSFIKR